MQRFRSPLDFNRSGLLIGMKCVAVSDFHMHDIDTPDADLLIVAGDMTMRGAKFELQWFSDWLSRQPQKYKVWIAGNHELGIEDNPSAANDIAAATGSIYLNGSSTVVGDLKIWGSPVTPWFHDWAFNIHRGDAIASHWQLIPENIDLLITHGPPHGYLDLTMGDEHVGCEELLDVLACKLKRPPRYHVFGHIHFAYGRETLKRSDGKTISLINASICDEHYQARNAPQTFSL